MKLNSILKTILKTDNHRIEPYIFAKVDKKMVKITLDKILFIEGMKEYIKVATIDKTYITHKSLSSLSEELPLDWFISIHKSYTIAIDKVKSLRKTESKFILTPYPLVEITVKM